MLFTAAAAISAVLCVAVCVLWVRGGSAAERASLRTPYRETALLSGSGSLWLLHGRLDFAEASDMDGGEPAVHPVPGWSGAWDAVDPEELPDWIVRAEPGAWPPAWLPARIDQGAPPNWWSESPPFKTGWQLTVRC